MVYTPHSLRAKGSVYFRWPEQGINLWSWVRDIREDQDIADNYVQARVVSGGFIVRSNTITPSNLLVQGDINATQVQEIPELDQISTDTLLAYKRNERDQLASVSVSEGVVALAYPDGDGTFRVPPTNSIVRPDSVLVWRAVVNQTVAPGASITVDVPFFGTAPFTITVQSTSATTAAQYSFTAQAFYWRFNVLSNTAVATVAGGVSSSWASGAAEFQTRYVSQTYVMDTIPAINHLTFTNTGAATLNNVYVNVEFPEVYCSGQNGPGAIITIKGCAPSTSLSMAGICNYEVVPNADLSKEITTTSFVAGQGVPDDINMAQHLISVGFGDDRFRFLYDVPSYHLLTQSGAVSKYCTRAAMSRFAAGTYDVLSGLSDIGRLVGKAAPAVGGILGGLFGGPVGGTLGSIAGNLVSDVLGGRQAGGVYENPMERNSAGVYSEVSQRPKLNWRRASGRYPQDFPTSKLPEPLPRLTSESNSSIIEFLSGKRCDKQPHFDFSHETLSAVTQICHNRTHAIVRGKLFYGPPIALRIWRNIEACCTDTAQAWERLGVIRLGNELVFSEHANTAALAGVADMLPKTRRAAGSIKTDGLVIRWGDSKTYPNTTKMAIEDLRYRAPVDPMLNSRNMARYNGIVWQLPYGIGRFVSVDGNGKPTIETVVVSSEPLGSRAAASGKLGLYGYVDVEASEPTSGKSVRYRVSDTIFIVGKPDEELIQAVSAALLATSVANQYVTIIKGRGLGGASIGLAVACASLRVPFGPILTGVVTPDGRVHPVDNIDAKLTFARRLSVPLIFASKDVPAEATPVQEIVCGVFAEAADEPQNQLVKVVDLLEGMSSAWCLANSMSTADIQRRQVATSELQKTGLTGEAAKAEWAKIRQRQAVPTQQYVEAIYQPTVASTTKTKVISLDPLVVNDWDESLPQPRVNLSAIVAKYGPEMRSLGLPTIGPLDGDALGQVSSFLAKKFRVAKSRGTETAKINRARKYLQQLGDKDAPPSVKVLKAEYGKVARGKPRAFGQAYQTWRAAVDTAPAAAETARLRSEAAKLASEIIAKLTELGIPARLAGVSKVSMTAVTQRQKPQSWAQQRQQLEAQRAAARAEAQAEAEEEAGEEEQESEVYEEEEYPDFYGSFGDTESAVEEALAAAEEEFGDF